MTASAFLPAPSYLSPYHHPSHPPVAKRPRTRLPQPPSTTSFIPPKSFSIRTSAPAFRSLRPKNAPIQCALPVDHVPIAPLNEALSFLAATTITVPIFRRFNLSPILAFLLAGVILGPHGTRLIKDVDDIQALADFGVLFLLFEMGLELSLDRLRKLRKYAFGMGTFQVTLTSLVLSLGAYAMGASVPESAVIGTALSLSSSAFILQILAENKERQSRAGIATFGILLLQDIAVVPLLLLVPLLNGSIHLNVSSVTDESIHAIRDGAQHLVATLGTLNVVVLAGGAFLKRVFSIVAESKSSETFTSTVLLTVLGTALLTEKLGLSMTMGSFLAGVLLAESSFRSRIKIDLEPFRGLFLGLFFITTGMELDLSLFVTKPHYMLFLISSLIFWKSTITTFIGLPFGLSLAESVRVGLLLAQGGEFAFVIFALGRKLGFLPDDVNSFLITTVVASMALTPLLYNSGKYISRKIDALVRSSGGTITSEAALQDISGDSTPYVLICGYGPVGQVVGRMLSRKFIRWVAVDIDMKQVNSAVEQDFPVLYGDIVRISEIIEANSLSTPAAFVISVSIDEVVEDTLIGIRCAYPDRPVYLRAKNVEQQKEYLKRGATAMYPESFETSLQLGQSVLAAFNTSKVDIKAIKEEVREDSGLADTFDQYEEWFKENMRAPGGEDELDVAMDNGAYVGGNGTVTDEQLQMSENAKSEGEKRDTASQTR